MNKKYDKIAIGLFSILILLTVIIIFLILSNIHHTNKVKDLNKQPKIRINVENKNQEIK